MTDAIKVLIHRIGHGNYYDKRRAEDQLATIIDRALFVAGRGQDNDGDNKSGAKSMRAALHQIVDLLTEPCICTTKVAEGQFSTDCPKHGLKSHKRNKPDDQGAKDG